MSEDPSHYVDPEELVGEPPAGEVDPDELMSNDQSAPLGGHVSLDTGTVYDEQGEPETTPHDEVLVREEEAEE